MDVFDKYIAHSVTHCSRVKKSQHEMKKSKFHVNPSVKLLAKSSQSLFKEHSWRTKLNGALKVDVLFALSLWLLCSAGEFVSTQKERQTVQMRVKTLSPSDVDNVYALKGNSFSFAYRMHEATMGSAG